MSTCFPGYPCKRTLLGAVGMSQTCHERTLPYYSITSSARASNVGGAVRPSVLAVLRHERQRPPEPPPLRRRYHPSLWRGFSFDLDFLEDLLKCFHPVPLYFVFRLLL
jgi:hypothetical protein